MCIRDSVYGDLRLTKVDKDYPDNKLTGAEFEVYRDTNGNKELDGGCLLYTSRCV